MGLGHSTGPTTLWCKRKTVEQLPHIYATDLLEECRTGDIILYRQAMTIMSQVDLMPVVTRGILGTLNNQFIGKTVSLPLYTNAGIISNSDGIPVLFHPTAAGIEQTPLQEILQVFHTKGIHLSWRKLTVTSRDGLFNERFSEIYKMLTSNNGILWSKMETEMLEKKKRQRHKYQGEEKKDVQDLTRLPNEDTQLGDFPTTAAGFADMLLKRVAARAGRLPAEGEAEARRGFFELDAGGAGKVGVAEAARALAGLHRAEYMGSKSPEEIKRFMEEIFQTVDIDGDGLVTWEEFLDAYKNLPRKSFPIENDIMGMLCGEFLAAVLLRLGVLEEEEPAPPPPAAAAGEGGGDGGPTPEAFSALAGPTAAAAAAAPRLRSGCRLGRDRLVLADPPGYVSAAAALAAAKAGREQGRRRPPRPGGSG